MRFNCIRLLVSDFAGCYKFYTETLGFEPTIGDVNDVFAAFLSEGGVEISIFKKDLMARVVGTNDLPAQVRSQDGVVMIFQVDNVDEKAREFEAKGVKLVSAPCDRNEWGIRTAHFRDPEGNLIEIFNGLR